MRLLDVFCCEGGASVGYHRAGFEVVGVDIADQPRYPFPFYLDDALAFLDDGSRLQRFDAIHASPLCRAHTRAQKVRGNDHPDLIGPTRPLLEATGLPYVIENVVGAPLVDPIMLCGMMFGKPYYRHRLFECSFPVSEPLHGQHYLKQAKMGRSAAPDEAIQAIGNFSGVQRVRDEFEMPWASRDGLRECVPPVYTEYIGRYLAAEIAARKAAAA